MTETAGPAATTGRGRKAGRPERRGLTVERVEGDLRDQASLRHALTGCRQLYHIAAHYALWAKDPSIFYDVNVTGTKTLLEAARDVGTERIVYCSTIGAIGIPPEGGLGTEETPVMFEQMAGHYKRSKYLAEQEVLKLAKAGLPVVIVNPSAPVGIGDVKPTPTGQVIVDFMKGRMPAYIETGMNIVDVDDVATGHLLAMEKGRIGERYILGGEDMSVFLERVPGCFFFIGSAPSGEHRPHHSPRFDIDERALAVAVRLFEEVALEAARRI